VDHGRAAGYLDRDIGWGTEWKRNGLEHDEQHREWKRWTMVTRKPRRYDEEYTDHEELERNIEIEGKKGEGLAALPRSIHS
jgi:hypothetical protein